MKNWCGVASCRLTLSFRIKGAHDTYIFDVVNTSSLTSRSLYSSPVCQIGLRCIPKSMAASNRCDFCDFCMWAAPWERNAKDHTAVQPRKVADSSATCTWFLNYLQHNCPPSPFVNNEVHMYVNGRHGRKTRVRLYLRIRLKVFSAMSSDDLRRCAVQHLIESS